MTDKAITNPDALLHLNSAKAKLQKAIAALDAKATTERQLHSAIGNVLSAGRSLKRAAEADKHHEEKRGA